MVYKSGCIQIKKSAFGLSIFFFGTYTYTYQEYKWIFHIYTNITQITCGSSQRIEETLPTNPFVCEYKIFCICVLAWFRLNHNLIDMYVHRLRTYRMCIEYTCRRWNISHISKIFIVYILYNIFHGNSAAAGTQTHTHSSREFIVIAKPVKRLLFGFLQ